MAEKVAMSQQSGATQSESGSYGPTSHVSPERRHMTQLLPTKKVTAFVLGGALTLIGFWLLVDVFGILEQTPDGMVVGAFVILIGAIVAWIVPESAWGRLQGHLSGEVETAEGTMDVEGAVSVTPQGDDQADVEGEVTMTPKDSGQVNLGTLVTILIIVVLVLLILRLA